MPKPKASSGTGPRYEVVDEAKVKDVVDLLVDFSQEKKLPARTVMLAMEYIVAKIKSHLEIESITVADSSDSIH